MFGIKGFEHVERYIEWAKKKYNVEFIQLPHFANASYIKEGYLGIKKSEVKNYTLNSIIEIAKKQAGVDWVILGMKQSDGLNRRLMLKTYELQAINEKTKKVYPLSHWANSDVMKYIELNNLIKPISYNKDRSSGFEPNSIDYLLFLKNKYPKDLEKLLSVFPMAAQKLFEYEYHKTNEENRNI
jgi:sulfate adenylyltransferase subunit 2